VSATGGTSAPGGTTSTTGGTSATGGTVAATGGVPVDQGGKTLAKAGDKTSNTNDYLYLGNMRLINNNWGSVELKESGVNCNAPMSVAVNSDGSLGWTFNRGDCNDDGSHPDYPELEFGVAPFGTGSSLLTSPPFSSTTLLPVQIKDISSASVAIDNFSISLQSSLHWNLNIEFWLSERNPLTNADAGAYAELMGLFGWNNGSWACDANLTSNTVNSGGKSYRLCHQSNTWGSGPTWRFFQFEIQGGPLTNFTGTVDIKAFLDWLLSSSYGSQYSRDLWLTRIELGSEIDDSTSGTCTIKNATFTINGTAQGIQLAK
jgi:hypothetical protein